jgi:flagellin
MGLSITNNISSLVAQQNLTNSTNSLNTSLQRLSSGLKINSGGDGPAALVISNEQGAQIAGLQSAINNTNQAVSLVQTAEGALSEVNDLLVQIRGLALSAANSAVNDPTALAADQAQIQNALQTIDRISQNTQFGTKRLLNGSSAAVATLAASGSSNVQSVSGNTNTAAGSYEVRITQQGQAAQLVGAVFSTAGTVSNSATTVQGTALSGPATIGTSGSNATAVGTYNVTVTQQGLGDSISGASAGQSSALASGVVTFSGGALTSAVSYTINAADAFSTTAAGIQAALNSAVAAGTPYTATVSAGGVLTIQDANIGVESSALTVQSTTGGASAATGLANGQVGSTGANLQVSITGGPLTNPLVLGANGPGGSGTQVQVASGPAQGLTFNIVNANGATAVAGTSGSVTVTGSDTLTLNGTAINLNANNASTASDAAATINAASASTGVNASVSNGSLVLTAAQLGGANFTVGESGGNIGIANTTPFFQNAQDLQAVVYDVNGNQLGGTITGTGPGGNVITANGSTFGPANGLSFTFNYASTLVNGVANTLSPVQLPAGQYTATVSLTDGLQFQIGANADQTATLSIQNTSSGNLGKDVGGLSNANTDSLAKINVTSTAGANDALLVIDQAINDVSTIRGNLGAFQTNTLQATAANLSTTLTNTTAAQSVIRDTDFAAETANFTKDQVLVQADTTVLSNANATSQLVLALIKNA